MLRISTSSRAVHAGRLADQRGALSEQPQAQPQASALSSNPHLVPIVAVALIAAAVGLGAVVLARLLSIVGAPALCVFRAPNLVPSMAVVLAVAAPTIVPAAVAPLPLPALPLSAGAAAIHAAGTLGAVGAALQRRCGVQVGCSSRVQQGEGQRWRRRQRQVRRRRTAGRAAQRIHQRLGREAASYLTKFCTHHLLAIQAEGPAQQQFRKSTTGEQGRQSQHENERAAPRQPGGTQGCSAAVLQRCCFHGAVPATRRAGAPAMGPQI